MYRVLLADDEPIILSGLQSMLDWERQGCTVCGAARDGQQALELVEIRRPDIVICDITMPRLTGLELLEACAQQYPQLVFVMLTNHQDFHMAQQSLRGRAVDYLLKIDLDEEKLAHSLRLAIDECEKRRRLCAPSLPRQAGTLAEAAARHAAVLLSPEGGYGAERAIAALEGLGAAHRCAAAIGITPNYLSSLFKRQLGQNFMDYVNATKVKYACALLQDGTHMVYEVSHMLGYDNAYYFTKVFKRYMNMTPTEYQARAAAQADSTQH